VRNDSKGDIMAKGGKPRRFKTPEVMQKELKKYEKYLEETGKPFLLIGFANFCGVHRTILDGYADKPEYSDTIKQIKQKAELDLLEGAMSGTYNATASIFFAKNNHNYTDKTESVTDNTHRIQVERKTLKPRTEAEDE